MEKGKMLFLCLFSAFLLKKGVSVDFFNFYSVDI